MKICFDVFDNAIVKSATFPLHLEHNSCLGAMNNHLSWHVGRRLDKYHAWSNEAKNIHPNHSIQIEQDKRIFALTTAQKRPKLRDWYLCHHWFCLIRDEVSNRPLHLIKQLHVHHLLQPVNQNWKKLKKSPTCHFYETYRKYIRICRFINTHPITIKIQTHFS